MNDPPPDRLTWRVALRHAATVVWIALVCGVVAPVIATVLLVWQLNGLSLDLLYSPVMAPLTVLYAGPAAFLLGLVFGWMLVGLVWLGLNHLGLRVAVAMLVATLAWSLAGPLALSDGGMPAGDPGAWDEGLNWLVLNGTAGATALVFRRRWLARRVFGVDDPVAPRSPLAG